MSSGRGVPDDGPIVSRKDRFCEGKKEPRSSGTPPPSLAVLDAEVAKPGIEDGGRNWCN